MTLARLLRGQRAGLGILASLSAVHYSHCVFDERGRIIGWKRERAYGIISRRVVTNNGVAFLADCFMNTAEAENLNYHDCGTGVVAENVTDSALGTPYGGARGVGVQSKPAANQYKSVGTISFTGPFAITEHGLFSAAAVGTLFDRSVFAAINVVNLDAIAFSWILTLTAGG